MNIKIYVNTQNESENDEILPVQSQLDGINEVSWWEDYVSHRIDLYYTKDESQAFKQLAITYIITRL